MGKLYQVLEADHQAFIEEQPLFFVASAPLLPTGHINLSPKGLEAFRVLDDRTVTYLDLTGSGNETAAHLTENGLLTLMFCAFSGHPKILRLYCRGRVVTRLSHEWEDAVGRFPVQPGIRQVVVAAIESVQTSCGFGVPLMTFDRQRDQLTRWAESRSDKQLVDYRRSRNAVTLDGMRTPPTDH